MASEPTARQGLPEVSSAGVGTGPTHYRRLDPEQIIKTAAKLEQRVGERFPESGLRNVAVELTALARDLSASSRALQGPIWWVREFSSDWLL